jgi:hypothetical protein
VENYTVDASGGTDVTPYFGARRRSCEDQIAGLSVQMATPNGSAGLTAGTRVPLNPFIQKTFKVPKTTTGELASITVPIVNPTELGHNEGAEIILIASSGDTTGYLTITTQFDWFKRSTRFGRT